MENLTSKRLESLYEQLSAVQDINAFSFHHSELWPMEFLYLKYKLAYIIANLLQLNIGENLADYKLPNVETVYEIWRKDSIGGEESMEQGFDWYSESYDLRWEFDEAAQVFLYEVLRGTSWEIDIIEDLIEYDLLSDEFIQACHQEISLHWGALNEMSGKSLKSERLKSLGCDAELHIDCNSYGNVCVTNKRINDILKVGRRNEKCKEDKKFKKLIQILKTPLFYRYYPGYCHTFDENSTDEYYECYNLGDCYETDEFVSFYQLDYAQVVGLLYADVLAEDLQKKYIAIEEN